MELLFSVSFVANNFLLQQKNTHVANLNAHIVKKKCLSEYHLKRHMSSFHPPGGGLPFFCDLCNKKFKNRASYTDHVSQIHRGVSTKCDICGITFKSLKYYKVHIKRRMHAEKARAAGKLA